MFLYFVCIGGDYLNVIKEQEQDHLLWMKCNNWWVLTLSEKKSENNEFKFVM